MHVTVFGATSSTGRLVLDQALARGHQVTAFTRDAAKVAPRRGLRVMTGEVTDVGAVRQALSEADAVIVTLGAGRKGVVREAGTRAVVEAMQETGVRRLVCQSTLGTGISRDNLNFFWKRVMFGALLRQAYADHVRQEEVVSSSDLDWTIVRPSAFSDAEVPGVRHGFGGDERGLSFKVSRSEVAAFLLAQAEQAGAAPRAISLSA